LQDEDDGYRHDASVCLSQDLDSSFLERVTSRRTWRAGGLVQRLDNKDDSVTDGSSLGRLASLRCLEQVVDCGRLLLCLLFVLLFFRSVGGYRKDLLGFRKDGEGYAMEDALAAVTLLATG
jgi:hypothetical protein